MSPEERNAVIEECANVVQRLLDPIISDLKRGDVSADRKKALAIAFNFYNRAMINILAIRKR